MVHYLGLGIFVAIVLLVTLAIRARNMQAWITPYIKQRIGKIFLSNKKHTHVYFCLADHFEPYWRGASAEQARARMTRWSESYASLAKQHKDSDGKHPQHSFFYPEEEYDVEILNALAEITKASVGDVEIHLHHDNDTAENLESTLLGYKQKLFSDHGLLRKDGATGKIIYSFIHGNWALDNSRPDGRYCGVDNELDILVDTGCYADMTMPSAPSDTQTSKINSIYFAKGKPGERKSHNIGRDVARGSWQRPGELLMIQGPLALNWRSRKWGLIPRIESGELSQDAPPTAERVRLWGSCNISVKGAEEFVFIKVHTHGAEDGNIDMFFNGGFERLWSELEQQYRDTKSYSLHYVTAWELFQKVRSLAVGHEN